MDKEEKVTTQEEQEENLYTDFNKVMVRCHRILAGKCDIPKEYDTLEGALAKMVIIISDLCDRIEKPNIIVPGR